jgi:cytochrome c oxidase assembly protein subunit 16
MPAFQSNKFRGAGDMGKAGARYRALLAKRPFLTFGLPFMAVIVAGSFVLTPATAVRYERHDRKVRQMTKEEELGVRRGARKVDMREEYNVSACKCLEESRCGANPFAAPCWHEGPRELGAEACQAPPW